LVVPGLAFAPECIASGTGLLSGIGGSKPNSFFIKAKDRFGNFKSTGGDNFRVVVQGTKTFVGTVKDNTNGSYSIMYAVTDGGSYQISITLNGLHIAGSPYKVFIVSGGTDGTLSKEDLSAMYARYRTNSEPPQVQTVAAKMVDLSLSEPRNSRSPNVNANTTQLHFCVTSVQAHVKGFLARKLAKRFRKRRQVASEILSSEKTYVDNLEILKQCFMEPLRKAASTGKPILSSDKIGLIFSNLDFIKSINGELLTRLDERIANWYPEQQVGDVFVDLADALRYSYAQYINNYDQALKTLSFCSHQESNFQHFLEQNKNHPKHGYLDIGSYLILPVQRLPRYTLLLEKLVEYTPNDNSDYENLRNALLKIKDVTDFVNDNKKKAENLQKIISIQSSIIGKIKSLFHLNREFISEQGFVVLQGKQHKIRQFFLFNDIILITKPVKKNKFQYKSTVPLYHSIVSTSAHDELSFHLYNKPGNIDITIFAEKKEILTQWVSDIQKLISSIHSAPQGLPQLVES